MGSEMCIRDRVRVGDYPPGLLGRCPSGQRERAVNPSALPSEVQILPGPPDKECGRVRFGGPAAVPESGHWEVRYVGSSVIEYNLHDGDVLPAPELAPYLAFHPNLAEAVLGVQGCAGLVVSTDPGYY